MTGGSQERRPPQQVESQIGKQEAVGRNPTDGLQHDQSSGHEVRCRAPRAPRRSQRRQSSAQTRGLPLKPANPELTPLIGHGRLRSGCAGSLQSTAIEQTRDQKQRDDRNTEAKIGQGELRQQRNRTLARAAQVAAHADRSVKPRIHQCAAVEAIRGQPMASLAPRTVVRPVTIWVGNLFGILLDGTCEGVGFAQDLPVRVAETPESRLL